MTVEQMPQACYSAFFSMASLLR